MPYRRVIAIRTDHLGSLQTWTRQSGNPSYHRHRTLETNKQVFFVPCRPSELCCCLCTFWMLGTFGLKRPDYGNFHETCEPWIPGLTNKKEQMPPQRFKSALSLQKIKKKNSKLFQDFLILFFIQQHFSADATV